MSIKEETLEFINSLQTAYFTNWNIEFIKSHLDIDVGWSDLVESASLNDLRQVKELLSSRSLQLQNAEYRVKPLGENFCLACGRLDVRLLGETGAAERLSLRLTIVCRKAPEGMRLSHLQISCPDMGWEDRERQSCQSQLEALTENIPGGVQQRRNDPGYTLLQMNQNFLQLCGYDRGEIESLFENRFINLIYPGDRAGVLKSAHDQLARGNTVELEYRLMCKDKPPLWVLDKGRLMENEGGEQTFYCVLVDINERKKEQEELRLSLERHEVILDQATDVIFEWDILKDTLTYSKNWQKKFGYAPIDAKISKRLPHSVNIHPDDLDAFMKIMRDTQAGVPYSETRFRIRRKEDDFTWCRIRATTQYDHDGRPIKAVGVIVDIDAEKKYEMKLLEQAQRDALTGLYNKAAVRLKAEDWLRGPGGRLVHALMMIDVDNFKALNDRFGHLCGDAVLNDVSDHLKRLFRASDVIGRVGGDEFFVFLPDIVSEENAAAKARAVQEAVSGLTLREDMGFPLSCSIGVALCPRDARDYVGLYQCADRALYYVKSTKKGAYAFYNRELCDQALPLGAARSAISEIIDARQSGAVDAALLQNVIRMLYGAVDVKTGLEHILEVVGRAYQVSRVYIFENSEDGRRCSNTFEWCNEGIPSEMENLQELDYEEDLSGYLRNFDDRGVFYCRDIKTLEPALRAILEPQKIVSLLQCAILDDGECKGYVGFDECGKNRYWTQEQVDSLTMVAHVLGTFLLKQRLKERVERLCAGQRPAKKVTLKRRRRVGYGDKTHRGGGKNGQGLV